MKPLDRLRAICLALPEAEERYTWEHENFRVRDRIFCMFVRHGDRPAFTCKAPPGAQAVLLGADPARFFRPAYTGPKGWVGMYLDRGPDWDEAAALIRRSWTMTAPKRLVKQEGNAT